MKALILSAVAFIISFVAAHAQSYQFRDQYGMPTGSAQWQGNGWQYRDQYGMPTGSSQYQGWNNSWQFRDQYGIISFPFRNGIPAHWQRNSPWLVTLQCHQFGAEYGQ